MNRTPIFNNEIELGLRIAIILNTIYPKSIDLETINYLDYISLHTSDFGGAMSLHSPVPNRSGELSVKRKIILQSLNFLILRGLVEQIYTNKGIEYLASDYTTPFVDSLNEQYSLTFIDRIQWVNEMFGESSTTEFRKLISRNQENWENDIVFSSIGILNEK